MKKLFLASALLVNLAAIAGPGGGRSKYIISVDLNKVNNDMLDVEVIVPQVGKDEIEFQMPKMVPGTYAIYDFGRFLSNFKAYDSLDNELTVRSITENRWQITNAKKLYKLKYKVEDTYDTKQDNKIFEPAGTSIEEGKVFVMNTFGFFGYLDGMKNMPFELNVTRPTNFYGATSLKRGTTTGNTDVFLADNYFDFHDSPILFCEPDTAMIPVGNCMVTVAVYSPKKKLKADEVRNMVSETMDAQRKYLGGTLPVDRYSILIYLFDGMSNSGASGALEHCYSTAFSMPEAGPKELEQTIKDVTAHEFFHIVTPLNIHSEHIADYDFINPQMSKHLWMYEGCTEYAAHHVQVKYGLISFEDYLDDVKQKMTMAQFYSDDLPFTEMSKGALDKYKDQYGNVYQKGALIGMCVDIKLRQLSGGKYGIQNLMKDLSKKYGKDNFFLDDNLFNEIATLTYPEMGDFLNKYVGGKNALPFKEILGAVGIDFVAEKKVQKLTFGKLGIGFNEATGRLVIKHTMNISAFGKKLGLRDGDEFVALNGEAVTVENAQEMFTAFQSESLEGDKVKVTVARKNKEGQYENKILKGKATLTETTEKNVVSAMANPTPEQIQLRKFWLESEP